MLTVDPKTTPTADLHQYLLGAVAPRPIAFVSTISENGTPNLAPYSFFNAFSSNPPIVIFSSNRRVRDNTTKHTLGNIREVDEVVINMVSHSIARQMTIASIEYDEEVSEFDKAGFTPVPSDLVKPFRVKESPVQMECKVREIISLGDEGGAGNLMVCEVVRMHIEEGVLDENGRIDPQKIDLMARMGRAFYCRASGPNVFPIVQPVNQLGIGFDGLPGHVRQSSILTGNQLAEMAALMALPDEATIAAQKADPRVMDALAGNQQDRDTHLHRYAQELIDQGEVEKALAVVMAE